MMRRKYLPICLLAWVFCLPATGTLAPQSRHNGYDLAEFAACVTGPGIPQNDPNCAGMRLDDDDDVDQNDFALFQVCYGGTDPAAAECTGQGGGLPASGTFAMHGRPVDVLPDGHALLFVRARHYDLNNGRWLQRDPKGYLDGGNLYEAFGNNALRFNDPAGTEIWATTRRYQTDINGTPVWAVDYHIHRNGMDLGLGGVVYPHVVDSRRFRTEYYPFTEDLRTLARYDGLIESSRHNFEAAAILGEDIFAYEKAIRIGGTAVVALPVAAIAAPAASTAFSTTTVGITTTTVGGNIAAASLTGAVSLGAGGAVAEGLVGGDARQIAIAGLEHAAIGGVTGGVFGTAMPAGIFSVVTAEGQAVSIFVSRANASQIQTAKPAAGPAAPLTGKQLIFPFAEPVTPLKGVPGAGGGAPKVYSVAFETRLAPIQFGLGRSEHFRVANQALQAERVVNPALAKLVPAPAGVRLPPLEWTWQHATIQQGGGYTGVLQLVPRYQHTPGSPFWNLLHPLPSGAGGYWEWAVPAGAP